MDGQENDKELALKMASSCITKGEMKTLISICESRYNEVNRLNDAYIETMELARDKVNSIKDKMKEAKGVDITQDSMFKAIMKVTEGVRRKMQKEFMDAYGDTVMNFDHLVEFLNKFSEKEHKMIDFSDMLEKDCPWLKD